MEFDFGTIIFFAAFLWFLISEIRPKKKPRSGTKPPGRRAAEPPVRYTEPVGERAAGLRYDAELERRRLERLLKGLDPDGGPVIVSLETEPARAERRREAYDDRAAAYDDRAEAASRARIEAAQARDRALNAADHAAFDRRIRRVDQVASGPTRSRSGAGLRQAVVWREILGPPVSLREEDAWRST